MKKLLCIAISLLSLNAFAADNLGLGLILGGPTGISANYKFQEARSMDFALSYDFDDDDDEEIYLHSTYLFRFPKQIDIKSAYIGWYAGVGGRFIYEEHRDDDVRLGVRGSAGANIEFKKVPVEIFAELGPVLDIVEETDFDLDAALGARFYF